MLCPSCSAAALDAYGRCPHCGYSAVPPAQPYAAYYPQPSLISPTAPAGIGLAAQILLAVAGVLALVSFGTNIWAFTVAKTAYDTGGTNVDAINAVAGVAGLFALFSGLLGLAAGIVFIIWFYKSANLAAILAPGRQALSAGWAIGGWFIPLAWYVLPRVVAGGVWRASIPLAAQPVTRRPRTYLVTWWWLSFCVGETLLSEPVSPSANNISSFGGIVFSSGLVGFADFCRLVSAILGILMIRKLTQMQQIRILQGPGLGHPYAAPPVMPTVPYAAYTEPAVAPFSAPAPVSGQVGPYGPTTGTPYAPSQPQSQPQAQPAPQDAAPVPPPYTPSLPPQAAPPVQESLPATKPTPEPAITEPAAEAAGTVAEATPEDAVPADVPTAVIPRQAQDRATVLLTPVAGADATADAATDAGATAGTETPQPQDAVPPAEPREA